MAALCAKDRNFKAEELLDAILANCVAPNSETYILLLETLKSRKLEACKGVRHADQGRKG